jgi:hypothetical protein
MRPMIFSLTVEAPQCLPKDIPPTTTSASTLPLLPTPNQTDEVLSYVAQIRIYNKYRTCGYDIVKK